jgi:putative nucleotidyltransferase with HDIG domain
MNIPSDEDCERILKHFGVPERIVRHSRFVWELSEYVAGKLIAKGIPVDLKLLKAAAILHDIDKIKTLETGDHGIVAYVYLKKDYPEVAEVVVSHVTANVEHYPPDT